MGDAISYGWKGFTANVGSVLLIVLVVVLVGIGLNVLGVVFERTKSKTRNSVPFFGDIPYLGWAFQQNQIQDENSELLIFVTPKILKDTLSNATSALLKQF